MECKKQSRPAMLRLFLYFILMGSAASDSMGAETTEKRNRLNHITTSPAADRWTDVLGRGGEQRLRSRQTAQEEHPDVVVDLKRMLEDDSAPTPAPTSQVDRIISTIKDGFEEDYRDDSLVIGVWAFIVIMTTIACCMAVLQECCGIVCCCCTRRRQKYARKRGEVGTAIHTLDRRTKNLPAVQEEKNGDFEDSQHHYKDPHSYDEAHDGHEDPSAYNSHPQNYDGGHGRNFDEADRYAPSYDHSGHAQNHDHDGQTHGYDHDGHAHGYDHGHAQS